MIHIVSVGLVTAIAAMLLKSLKPDLAFAVTICGGIILLLCAVDLLKDTVSVFWEIADTTGLDASLIKLLLKMIGIGYLTEFSSQLISEFGSPSVADKVVLCGKIMILLLSVPIVKSLLELIHWFLAFV